MTMPHLENCPHKIDAHCLRCVKAEWERQEARVAELEREAMETVAEQLRAGETLAAAVLAEREACAKACDRLARAETPTAPNLADDCAEAIRARGGQ